jgi:hypothetical protein
MMARSMQMINKERGVIKREAALLKGNSSLMLEHGRSDKMWKEPYSECCNKKRKNCAFL